MKNVLLWFITWLMAVVLFLSGYLWTACVPSFKPVCVIGFAVSALWLTAFFVINAKYLERSMEDESA